MGHLAHRQGREGEQHAEDLGLMDALRGRSKSAFAERIKCKIRPQLLLNEFTPGRSCRLSRHFDPAPKKGWIST
jgi:hypothetical protein